MYFVEGNPQAGSDEAYNPGEDSNRDESDSSIEDEESEIYQSIIQVSMDGFRQITDDFNGFVELSYRFGVHEECDFLIRYLDAYVRVVHHIQLQSPTDGERHWVMMELERLMTECISRWRARQLSIN